MPATLDDRGFAKAKKVFSPAAARATKRVGEVGEQAAIGFCPVGDRPITRPHLYETIHLEGMGLAIDLVAGDPSEGVSHTGFVEFGTTDMPAQPFMNPAITVMESAVAGAFKEEVGGALR